MKHQSPRNAFTLAEILTVVVIIGIAAAVIVPQIGTRDDLRAAAAARTVMADLLYAQNRAIATQSRHFVIFGSNDYRLATSVTPLVDVSHPVTKASNYLVSLGPGGLAGLEDCTLGDVSIEGRKVLVFDELGVPYFYDAATNSQTALSVTGGTSIPVSSGKFTLTLTIEPFTGEIKVN